MKSSFLKKLEKGLNLIAKDEREKIIKKYEKEIDKLIKEGFKEKEAVSSLGNVDVLISKVLGEYKISSKYIKKMEDKKIRGLEAVINDFVELIISFVNRFMEQDIKKIMEIFLYILIFIFTFWLLKIPFFIIEVIGIGFLRMFSYPLGLDLTRLWSFFISLIYLFLIIYTLVVIARRMEKGNIKFSPKEVLKEQKKVSNVLLILIKIFALLGVIPLILLQLTFLIILGLLIGLMIKGVLILGPILIIFAFLIIIGSFINLVFTFIFSKGGLD